MSLCVVSGVCCHCVLCQVYDVIVCCVRCMMSLCVVSGV